MRRRRWRTVVLWVGCTSCVLIAAAFVVSARWQVAVQFPTVRGPALYLIAGSVLIVTDQTLTAPVSAHGHHRGLRRWNAWMFRRIASKITTGPTIIVTFVEVPLYAPFLAVLLPTLLVWRFWPKSVKPGHCRCGYDLHGNESGVCPECGAEVQM